MERIEKQISIYKREKFQEISKQMLDCLSANGKGDSKLQTSNESLIRERFEKEISKNDIIAKRFQLGTSGRIWDFSKEKAQDVFASDPSIIIAPFRREYYENYYSVRAEWGIGVTDYKNDKDAMALEWKGIMDDYSFPCAVINRSDNAFIGYIDIIDTSAAIWEVSIELLRKYTGRGIGLKSLSLFLNRIKEITNHSQFRFCIEPDNVPCQHLMEKLGAELIGLYQYYFADEEDSDQFGLSHPELITDQIEAIARQLNVGPEKVISHVLEYRLSC